MAVRDNSDDDIDPIRLLPAGSGSWTFLGSGNSVYFQPVGQNQLRVDVTDNVLGVTVQSINYW